MTRFPIRNFCFPCLACASLAWAANVAFPQPLRLPDAPGAAAHPQPVASAPFVLNAAETKFTDDVLAYWEQRSARVKRFECVFTRFEYDAQFGPPSQPNTPRTISDGALKFEQPSNGEYVITRVKHYIPPSQAGEPATYEEREGAFQERWMCNEDSIMKWDYRNKILEVTELPPEMKGRAIVNGPLPFMFGAKAAEIKDRYWMRVLPPDDPSQPIEKYWIQAYPKRRADYANFAMVEVILDAKEFLPEALQVYPPGYNPSEGNYSRTSYVFANRVENKGNNPLLNPFGGQVWNPGAPFGWKKVVTPVEQPERVAPRGGPARR